MARDEEPDGLEGEVAAMQFAAGRSMVQLAEEWERDIAWVEAAVRRALLEQIPQRVGGLKPSRAHSRTERDEEQMRLDELQFGLEL
jgi:hypothetical protein